MKDPVLLSYLLCVKGMYLEPKFLQIQAEMLPEVVSGYISVAMMSLLPYECRWGEDRTFLPPENTERQANHPMVG